MTNESPLTVDEWELIVAGLVDAIYGEWPTSWSLLDVLRSNNDRPTDAQLEAVARYLRLHEESER